MSGRGETRRGNKNGKLRKDSNRKESKSSWKRGKERKQKGEGKAYGKTAIEKRVRVPGRGEKTGNKRGWGKRGKLMEKEQ